MATAGGGPGWLGSEQGEGAKAPRRAPSKRTPKGCCSVQGGPLWPPSGRSAEAVPGPKANQARGLTLVGVIADSNPVERRWASLCSRSLPQARQGAPLPAKPCMVAGGHRNLALRPREAPEEAG